MWQIKGSSPGTTDFHPPPWSICLSPGGICFLHSSHLGVCAGSTAQQNRLWTRKFKVTWVTVLEGTAWKHLHFIWRVKDSSTSQGRFKAKPAVPTAAQEPFSFRTSLLLQGRNDHSAYRQLLPQARLCPLPHQIYMAAPGQRYHSFRPHLTKEQTKTRNNELALSRVTELKSKPGQPGVSKFASVYRGFIVYGKTLKPSKEGSLQRNPIFSKALIWERVKGKSLGCGIPWSIWCFLSA